MCDRKLHTAEKLKTRHDSLPLVHILKHTTWSVCSGEDAFVCWNSWCFKKERFYLVWSVAHDLGYLT